MDRGNFSIERATPELLRRIASKGRRIVIARGGSDELRYLDAMDAEANVGGERLTDILLRPESGKAAVLEEFLHGTQHRIGLVQREGIAFAERHVKDFMIRHAKLLRLAPEDVALLRQLRDSA